MPYIHFFLFNFFFLFFCIGATILISRKIQCLSYAGFFILRRTWWLVCSFSPAHLNVQDIMVSVFFFLCFAACVRHFSPVFHLVKETVIFCVCLSCFPDPMVPPFQSFALRQGKKVPVFFLSCLLSCAARC